MIHRGLRMSTVVLHIVLIIGACIMALPFVWMVLSSLKDLSQVFVVPPKWIPDPFIWSNYKDSLTALPFGRAYFNSFYINMIVVLSQLVTCSMAAYAFAKITFPFREPLFILFLATMMVPGQVTIIPLYLIMKNIGWLDTHLAIIVPSALLNAFGVFLLRQFFRGIPKEMEEAAIVDGANRWTIYARIMLPLIKPALSALGIFTFLGMWNNFFNPLIFLSSTDKFTVPMMLNLYRGMYSTDWTLMMAGASIALIPVLIVYIIGQKYIIEGVTLSGIKG
ncbi:binding-protein-dependent transport systems inner membrane component [Paenibacillus vortex V453]|jgi:multiple sugar transport system permease protein|uniref:Sugar ABC transporter permease n=2 Tax=Paenibacillus TaxID=44249 RepID=A0A163K2N3_9BACL|nr:MULTISPECIES: carbohydrate ABC transporter permease [Paenibacillus]ANA80939.1 sugar ABC transporter permease [Paenibacillus glucanolyticus]AVV54988.1 carbohydrate ABC transporter permease [Paenibacillus glucanolyticus]AWP29574.1 sugar ABC transporter permease [Paenibacillus sp. Cedars]EFU42917.1 binding-protein-dependent transport systems inner membrane component [Paenibacillus vortex V453]ETT40655.1 binding-protein-dependent transport systems inner membrane component [Paenibacillus sp. FSL